MKADVVIDSDVADSANQAIVPISPLEFLRFSGIPVYRLRTQFRMANGLFHLCHENVCNDIKEVPYGPKSDISASVHDIGRALEAYTVEKYGGKGFKTAPAGAFQPIFIDCQDSNAIKSATGSTFNTGQSRAALDFIKDFVEIKRMDAGRLVLITPYVANVEAIKKLRSFYPTLDAMPPASTVDSFQGQEGDVCVLVLGTTRKRGPGFTTDDSRLNVALSRQRSVLVIVGDLDTTGAVTGSKRKGKKPEKGERYQVISEHGEAHWVKPGMLHDVVKWFVGSVRVVEWACGDKKALKGKD